MPRRKAQNIHQLSDHWRAKSLWSLSRRTLWSEVFTFCQDMFGSSISKVSPKVFNNAVVKHIHSSSALSNKFLGGFFERKVEQQQSSSVRQIQRGLCLEEWWIRQEPHGLGHQEQCSCDGHLISWHWGHDDCWRAEEDAPADLSGRWETPTRTTTSSRWRISQARALICRERRREAWLLRWAYTRRVERHWKSEAISSKLQPYYCWWNSFLWIPEVKQLWAYSVLGWVSTG